MKFRINILLLLILPFFSLAQTDGQVHWINGKKFVAYQIQPKDTWTSLAGKNGITIKELQEANKNVTDLKIGRYIYVPAGKSAVAAAEPKHNAKPLTHTVQKGETLYRISKMYNQSIEDIKKWNNLTSNNVPLGKTLIVAKDSQTATARPEIKEEKKEEPVATAEVKNAKEEPAAVNIGEKPVKEIYNDFDKPVKAEQKEEKPAKSEPETKNHEDPVKTTPSKSEPGTREVTMDGNVEKVVETGVATWLNDSELNQNKFYALHRTAPIGTIIKVTNRMTNNAVFVKVVGILPDTGDNANIIIKITQAAAQRIGAIDQKFTAELSYGITK